ncbi:Abi family protein [Nostoc sp.]|uniref:Abi family protein n=1 Tax=Nostoc sp. TaxID=1180 RepID=UPI002FFBCFE6
MPQPKLTDDELKDIVMNFSAARMNPYLSAANSNHGDAIRICQINTQLCEALYPSLHTLEIALRNTIDNVLSVKHGNYWLCNGKIQLDSYDQKSVKDVLNKCNHNFNHLIPELSFGFWKSLIEKKCYEQIIWSPFSKKIFKYAKSSERNIKQVRPIIKSIHWLRNRNFHHEPIWNYLQLDKIHSYIHCFLNWINPKVSAWLGEYDRFPQIYLSTSTLLEEMKVYRNKNLPYLH